MIELLFEVCHEFMLTETREKIEFHSRLLSIVLTNFTAFLLVFSNSKIPKGKNTARGGFNASKNFKIGCLERSGDHFL